MAPADDFERALALYQKGDAAAAALACERALSRKPDDPRVLHLLGVIRFAGGRKAEAVPLLRRAISVKPDYAEAEFNLGAMLADLGELDDASEHYGRAASLRPDHVEAHARHAAALMNARRFGAAETAYRQVLALEPDHAAAQTDLAALALLRGDTDAAVHHARRAATLAPENATAALRLGRALDQAGEHDEAVEQYRRAVRVAPDETRYRRNLIRAMLFTPGMPEAARAAEHRSFGEAIAARVGPALPLANTRDPDRRLRVGWLSSDFRQHPVGRNLEPVFAEYDRDRFEFVAYAEVDEPDDVTGWFRARTGLWRQTVGMNDQAVAEQIRADGIDVMVYLAGRFDHNRPEVAAWRPAPVQVSFHDPGTSGLAAMDYLIADPVLVPRRTKEWFAERVVRLPHLYAHRPLSDAPEIGPLPMLSSGNPTFVCFNNPIKLGPPVLGLWGHLLERLPRARLRLKYRRTYGSALLQARIREHFGSSAANRIDFDPIQNLLGEHLNTYNDADIALDPFPFSGSTTTFEALWMGVPVVTLQGETMVGRWSAAMLHSAKLDECVARTAQEYVDIVLRLVRDPIRLANLRAGLRQRVAASALCGGARATRHFERLIRALWRRRCRTA